MNNQVSHVQCKCDIPNTIETRLMCKTRTLNVHVDVLCEFSGFSEILSCNEQQCWPLDLHFFTPVML